MNKEDIIKLSTYLRRYYDADTSPDEERELRRLLSDPSLPEEFAADREMLRHIDVLCPPEGFSERLAAKVDEITQDSRSEQSASGNRGRTRRRSQRLRYSAAASVVLVACVGLTLILSDGGRQPQASLTPEETYAQVDKALTIFANSLNKGYAEVYKAEKITGSATAKALEALTTISKDNNSKSE